MHHLVASLVARAGPDAERGLRVRRTFDAPVSLVWKAWSRPEMLVAWIGAPDWPAFAVSVDFRAGGAWRVGLRSWATGEERWQRGEYVEVEEPVRLAFTFRWDGLAGPAFPPTLVTVDLRATEAGGTCMELVQEAGGRAAAPGGDLGWASAVDRLGAWLVDEKS